jgi:hypothetical protein
LVKVPPASPAGASSSAVVIANSWPWIGPGADTGRRPLSLAGLPGDELAPQDGQELVANGGHLDALDVGVPRKNSSLAVYTE